jgi:hypothetical protein
MKRIVTAIALITFIGTAAQSQHQGAGIASLQKSTEGSTKQKKLTDLVGVWEFTGEDNAGAYLEIIDSTNIILVYNGEKRKILDYKIDFQKSPIWFDFTTSDTTSIVSIKSLLEITNDNMLKWQLFIDEDRTPFFSSTKGEMVYLRKSTTTATATSASSLIASN